jgi:hypothetical protein
MSEPKVLRMREEWMGNSVAPTVNATLGVKDFSV